MKFFKNYQNNSLNLTFNFIIFKFMLKIKLKYYSFHIKKMETSNNFNLRETKIFPTEKEYLSDSYLFELSNCKVLNIENWPKDENAFAFIFEKTIFHPQGGGQPSDEGIIICDKIELKVESVSYEREKDLVLHKIVKKNIFQILKDNNLLIEESCNLLDLSKQFFLNKEFTQKINSDKRILFAKLHSAGHLLDLVVSSLGLNLIPGKGYHFPDGPYIEYNGNIDKNNIPMLCEEFQKKANEFIEKTEDENIAIAKFYDYEEGKNRFRCLPTYLAVNKPFRWVKLIKDDLGCPCGGTHVKHIKDIKKMKITKITNKGKVVRICYNVI